MRLSRLLASLKGRMNVPHWQSRLLLLGAKERFSEDDHQHLARALDDSAFTASEKRQALERAVEHFDWPRALFLAQRGWATPEDRFYSDTLTLKEAAFFINPLMDDEEAEAWDALDLPLNPERLTGFILGRLQVMTAENEQDMSAQAWALMAGQMARTLKRNPNWDTDFYGQSLWDRLTHCRICSDPVYAPILAIAQLQRQARHTAQELQAHLERATVQVRQRL